MAGALGCRRDLPLDERWSRGYPSTRVRARDGGCEGRPSADRAPERASRGPARRPNAVRLSACGAVYAAVRVAVRSPARVVLRRLHRDRRSVGVLHHPCLLSPDHLEARDEEKNAAYCQRPDDPWHSLSRRSDRVRGRVLEQLSVRLGSGLGRICGGLGVDRRSLVRDSPSPAARSPSIARRQTKGRGGAALVADDDLWADADDALPRDDVVAVGLWLARAAAAVGADAVSFE
jgi:hypothetical protein